MQTSLAKSDAAKLEIIQSRLDPPGRWPFKTNRRMLSWDYDSGKIIAVFILEFVNCTYSQWKAVSKVFKTRTAKQCQERWEQIKNKAAAVPKRKETSFTTRSFTGNSFRGQQRKRQVQQPNQRMTSAVMQSARMPSIAGAAKSSRDSSIAGPGEESIDDMLRCLSEISMGSSNASNSINKGRRSDEGDSSFFNTLLGDSMGSLSAPAPAPAPAEVGRTIFKAAQSVNTEPQPQPRHEAKRESSFFDMFNEPATGNSSGAGEVLEKKGSNEERLSLGQELFRELEDANMASFSFD